MTLLAAKVVGGYVLGALIAAAIKVFLWDGREGP